MKASRQHFVYRRTATSKGESIDIATLLTFGHYPRKSTRGDRMARIYSVLRSRRVGMRRPPLRLNVFCRESRKSSRTLARTSRIPYVLLTDRIGFVSFLVRTKNPLKLTDQSITVFLAYPSKLYSNEFFNPDFLS